MHTAKTMNVAVIYDGAALDFSKVYKKYFSRVKQRLVQLDNKSGFTRTNDQIEDLTQAFFTKVWANNILNSFDPNKAKSKDPILTFLNNHVWGFFKNLKEKETREANNMKELKQNFGIFEYKSEDNKFSVLPKSNIKNNVIANSTFAGNTHVEDNGFCHDIKKVSKAFIKSLKGLERRVYRLFKDQIIEADPKEIALQLGVSLRTSYRLKESIKSKAQEYMSGYYSGNINFN